HLAKGILGFASLTATTPTLTSKLANRKGFDDASQEASRGSGMPEVKFLIDRQTHKIYFLTPPFEYHYMFATHQLGARLPLNQFTRETDDTPSRRYIAGTVTAYDHFEAADGTKGAYALSYWSTDRVGADLIDETMGYLKNALPFAKDNLYYHPGGVT